MKTLPKRRSTLGLRGGAMALALTALTITACQTPQDTTTTDPNQTTTEQTTQDQQATEPDDVQVGDLAGNLEDYLGQTVSVRAEVVEVLNDNAFVIRGDGLFGGDDVLVFGPTDSPLVLPGEDVTERVQVTGQVQEVVIGQQSQQGMTLDEETYGQYEGNPAIMAESVALAPEPSEISDNPEAFYDQVIAVDAGIGEQYDNNTFSISGAEFFGGSNILVVGESADVASTIGDDGDVVILGTLRPFNAEELEREYNLTWDENLRQTIQSDYGEDPVLVAREVYPVNR
ncbi:hypothetical protein PGN35_025425 [Nodosilinea sp. PGN35]|uniref:hypothetical protein n=1 Tax=Nodosilinea sp. PGN35 TaxID=3020489 RepID=UPI0023B22D40|nr:hypothetical protein [Nodosilinea sp. TSF1-S3]MDF0367423.1 hypothetical protein [Nodosilinea sp. TSF1-S3]